MGAWIRNNFITGMAVLVPVLGTIWLFFWIFNKITQAGLKLMAKQTFWEWVTGTWWTRTLGRVFVLVVLVSVVVLVGIFAKNFFGRQLLKFSEKILQNIPLVRRIYITLKQISFAFLGHNKTVFKEVVLIEYPRRGLYALGFVTSISLGEIDQKIPGRVLNVFLPTTPNPTSGLFIMIPDKKIIHLSMSVEDGMKMVISGGAVMPEEGLKKLIDDEVLPAVNAGEVLDKTQMGDITDSDHTESQEGQT